MNNIIDPKYDLSLIFFLAWFSEYKVFTSDFDEIGYNFFNTDGSPDKLVNPNKKENGFSEYKYTAENTPQFNGFMIKVVMTANTQANPPRFKNFRSIALRSFEIT